MSDPEAQLEREWLRGSRHWRHPLLPSQWRGNAILGKGGQGIAARFSYHGRDRHGDAIPPRDVVVKQSLVDPSAVREAETLIRLRDEAQSRHIVRIYKRLYEDVGGGYGEYDLDGERVCRMFLEYCPGRDLEHMEEHRG